jgi:dCMP deaminase
MRPSLDEWGLALARVVATRGTCARRQVGCVLTDAKGRILATGYNGVAAGRSHCRDAGRRCPGALMKSGSGLDLCEAIHAEQNALLQCSDVRDIHTCYVTASPCVHCVKMLLNTGCRRIVFAEDYAHGESKQWWVESDRPLDPNFARQWICLPD